MYRSSETIVVVPRCYIDVLGDHNQSVDTIIIIIIGGGSSSEFIFPDDSGSDYLYR